MLPFVEPEFAQRLLLLTPIPEAPASDRPKSMKSALHAGKNSTITLSKAEHCGYVFPNWRLGTRKGRFATDDQIVFRIRPDRRQKPFRLLRVKVLVKQLVSNLIDDADVHRVCMQVDSAVEFMLLFVEFHHVLLRVSGLEPQTIEVEAR